MSPSGDSISLQSLVTKPSGVTCIVIASKHTPHKSLQLKLEEPAQFVIAANWESHALHPVMPLLTYEASVAISKFGGGSLFCPKLHDQRLLLPRQENELIIPRRVRLRAERDLEIPHHARKCKARFEVGETFLGIRDVNLGESFGTYLLFSDTASRTHREWLKHTFVI